MRDFHYGYKYLVDHLAKYSENSEVDLVTLYPF